MQMRSWVLASSFGVLFGIATSAGPAAAQGVDAAKVWKAKCASCHGADGKGKTKQGEKMGIDDMTGPEWQKRFSDDQIMTATIDGVSRVEGGKKQEMKPFKGKLTEAELQALVKYMRGLK